MSHEPSRRRPSKVSDEDLMAAARSTTNMRQMLLVLGIAAYGGNYEVMRRRLARLDLDDDHWSRNRRWTPELPLLASAVRCSRSWRELHRLLEGLGHPMGTTRVRRVVEEAGVSTAHFDGQGWRRGVTRPVVPAKPLDAVLVRGSLVYTSDLRKRLVREGVLAPRCAVCGRETWNGRPIPLELDHVNGDRTDNRLENLRLLCPNCHAQTDTYRGRNVGRPPSTGVAPPS